MTSIDIRGVGKVIHCTRIGRLIEINQPGASAGEVRRLRLDPDAVRQLADALHDAADDIDTDLFAALLAAMQRHPDDEVHRAYRARFEDDEPEEAVTPTDDLTARIDAALPRVRQRTRRP